MKVLTALFSPDYLRGKAPSRYQSELRNDTALQPGQYGRRPFRETQIRLFPDDDGEWFRKLADAYDAEHPQATFGAECVT